MCELHGCKVTKIKVVSKKWRWIESKKMFGNVNVQSTRIICSHQKELTNDEKTMTPTRNLVRGSGKVEEGIRALENIGTSKTNMFESESEQSG